MTGLYKYFKRHSLPNSSDTDLGDALTKEANAADQHVMEGATTTKGCKRKYTPEQRVPFFLAFALLNSSKNFQNYGTWQEIGRKS